MSLKTFVQEISSDPQKLDAFKKDPSAVMKQYGLTDEEIKAVESGDAQKVQALLGPAGGAHALFIFVYINR